MMGFEVEKKAKTNQEVSWVTDVVGDVGVVDGWKVDGERLLRCRQLRHLKHHPRDPSFETMVDCPWCRRRPRRRRGTGIDGKQISPVLRGFPGGVLREGEEGRRSQALDAVMWSRYARVSAPRDANSRRISAVSMVLPSPTLSATRKRRGVALATR